MAIEIKALRGKQKSIAFAYSSKERTDFSQKSIVPLLAEGDYDVYWIDGSTSEEGKSLPFRYESSPVLCEIHTGVRGGADAAIVYSLSLLLDKGYDYIGLLENDVMLEPGWWPRIFDLFEEGTKDGLLVGGVSARCYEARILVPRDGYGVMFDLGAGSALYTRQAVEHILDFYRTGLIAEISFLVANYTGVGLPVLWQMDGPRSKEGLGLQTADWFFQPNMLAHGLASLAPTPTLANKLDHKDPHDLQLVPTKTNPQFDWAALCKKLKETATRSDDLVRSVMANYDPALKVWRGLPHQILSTLPGTFQGDWKVKWSQVHGPFSMVTTKAGASIRLNMHGKELGIMLHTGGRPLALSIRGKFGEGKLSIAQKDEWQWAKIAFPHSGPFDLEITFDNSEIVVGYFTFEGPQSWFKSRYGLRYAHLKPFLE
jgi:hypothetical protein